MTEEAEKPQEAPAEAPKKKRSAKKPAADTKSPGEWMVECGQFTQGPRLGSRPGAKLPNWKHNVAATLHGWKQHAHDAQKEIQLTRADYEAALEAAGSSPPQPHPGALSPFCKLWSDS